MTVIPDIDKLTERFDLSTAQVKVQACLQWLKIILNAILLLMILVNIWRVLIK